MYTLVSSIAKPITGQKKWGPVDIGTMPMRQIYSNYREVLATLSNPFLVQEVCLDLKDIRSQYGGLDITFNQLLIDIGDTALPTSIRLPEITTQYAKYADAFHAGYKVKAVHPSISQDTDLPAKDKPWLLLSRNETNYQDLANNCVALVNGFVHRIESSPQGAYVVDGMKSQWMSGNNQIGLISFRELGTIKAIPITDDMVYANDGSGSLKTRCYINVKEDFSTKSVLLVIGGYLHVLDSQTFFRVGTNSLAVDFENYPLYNRFFESNKYLDFSDFPLDRTDQNDQEVSTEQLQGDACIRKLMTMSQSFIILLDNQNLYVDRDYVLKSRVPGRFISYYRPDFPLITGNGMLANYWYTHEDGQYSLAVKDNLWHHRTYYSVDPDNVTNIDDARIPNNPVNYSRGAFLKICADSV